MLYGEGSKAFLRLQQHIAAESNDLSLFAWEYPESPDVAPEFSGIFARSPDDFQICKNLRSFVGKFEETVDFSLSNRGLRIKEALESADNFTFRYNSGGPRRPHTYLQLECAMEDIKTQAVVPLIKVGGVFLRYWPTSLYHHFPRMITSSKSSRTDIYIRPYLSSSDEKRIRLLNHTGVNIIYSKELADMIYERYNIPSKELDSPVMPPKSELLSSRGQDNFVGAHVLRICSDQGKQTSVAVIYSLRCTSDFTHDVNYALVSTAVPRSHEAFSEAYESGRLDLERKSTQSSDDESLLRKIRRRLMEYSDHEGYPDQSKLPCSLECRDLNIMIQVTHLDKLFLNWTGTRWPSPLSNNFQGNWINWMQFCKENYHNLAVYIEPRRE
jgi:hypothetical protein